MIGGRFTYEKKDVKLKMIGNILGSINGSSLPIITGGFTSCIVTRSGVPCFYISNGTENYYITTALEPTTDTSPWRNGTSDICCSLIHCDTALTDQEFSAIKTIFLGFTTSGFLGAINFTENSESENLTTAKIAEVNAFLSETL